jgi:hypothetical protein
MDEKRVQRIFLVGVSILLVAAGIYLYVLIAPKKDKNNVVPKEVKLFPKDTARIYDNKMKAYNDLDKEKEQQQKVKDNAVNVDIGQLFDGSGKTNEETQKEEVKKDVEDAKPIKKEQTHTQVSTHAVKSVKQPVKPVKSTVQIEPEPPKTKPTSTGGLGIYTAKKKNTTSSEAVAEQNNFYPAYFDEDTKIKNNSPVVLILRSDATIDGISFKKNATFYGLVSDAGPYFDIQLTSCKNTDGKSYHLNDIVVYNEKYNRGIVHEGNLDKSVKESSTQSADNLTTTVSSASPIIGAATQTVSNTIKNLSQKRQPEISIRQGYKVFIKKN